MSEYTQREMVKFRKLIEPVTDQNACWEWNGALDLAGYGIFTADGKRYPAHRFAWIASYGAIPDGMLVLHNAAKCNNRACVNPAHLWLGTHLENARALKGDVRARPERRPKARKPHNGIHKKKCVYGTEPGQYCEWHSTLGRS